MVIIKNLLEMNITYDYLWRSRNMTRMQVINVHNRINEQCKVYSKVSFGGGSENPSVIAAFILIIIASLLIIIPIFILVIVLVTRIVFHRINCHNSSSCNERE